MIVEILDAGRLAIAAARHFGTAVEIEGLERLSGGASRETWAFAATGPDGLAIPLILRREPSSGGVALAPRVPEYQLIGLAAEAGAPIAPLRFALEPEDGLGIGFVSDRVAGETLGRRIVVDPSFGSVRPLLASQCGRALAAIHSIDVTASKLPGLDEGSSSAVAQLDQLTRLVDGFDVARPVVEFGLRWLRDHAPPVGRRCVVHGDFRLGNLIVGVDGLRAVLDWELAHVGDPSEDLGWLCVRSWRFGGPGRVGGVGNLTDLIDGYRSAGGEEVDDERVTYWEVFGNVRWAVICMVQAFTHLNGFRRSVELAAIGRRVCEAEHDLMELLS